MNIPNFLDCSVVSKDGKLTDEWRQIFMQLFKQLQDGISNEGISIPHQPTTNISQLTGNQSIGGVIYDSTLNQFKANVNTTWKQIPMAYNLVANKAVVTNANADITTSTTTDVQIDYLSNVTSDVQGQLNGKEPTITAGINSQYWRGDKTWQILDTSVVPENINLYYTDARARDAISNIALGLTYDPLTGVLSLTTGYEIPTSVSLPVTWNAPLQFSLGTVSITQSSSTTDGYLSSIDWIMFDGKQDALTFGNLTEATSSVLTINGGSNAVIGSGTSIQVKNASSTQDGYLSSTDWNTFNNKQNALTNPITGTGTSGQVAQFNGTTTITGVTENTAFNQNFETNTTNIKMDGSVSVGASSNIPRSDHVHPTDTSRADDSAVFHKAISGEINGLTVKTTPATGDVLLIEDSATSFSKKYVTINSLHFGLGQRSHHCAVETNANYFGRRSRSIAGTGAFRFDFQVPSDFSSLVALYVIGYPSAGAAGSGKNIDITIEYTNADNQLYNQYTASDTTSTYNLTGYTNRQYRLNITSLFTNLTANTEGGILVDHQTIGGTIDYVDVLLIYT